MRKLKTLICTIAIIVAGSSALLSADPLDFKNSVGVFVLGNVSSDEPGVKGIQYQRWCTDRFGFQTEGFITYQDQKHSYTDFSTLDFSVSTEALLKLYETPKGYRFASTLYAWGLVGIHGFTGTEYVESVGHYGQEGYVEGYYKNGGFKSDVMLGIGFGFDVMLLNHLSIPFQFGFEGEFPNDISAGFCMGAGLRYKF